MNDHHGEIAHAGAARLTGGCLIIASIIQMGVASSSFEIMFYGSWWAGMFVFLTGAMAIFTKTTYWAIGGLMLSIVSIILCLVGLTWDATGFLLQDLDICRFKDTGKLYGDEEYASEANNCAVLSPSRDCACVLQRRSSSNTYCVTFNVADDSCYPLMKLAPQLLVASFSFLVFMLVGSIVYSCFMCCSLCCHNSAAVVPINTSDTVPTLATYSMPVPSSQEQAQSGNSSSAGMPIYTATATVEDQRRHEGIVKYEPTVTAAPIMAYPV